MKYYKSKLLLCFIFFLSVILPGFSQTRADLWQEVKQAKSKGLPKTAIKHLTPIYEMAIKDRDLPDAAKALCEKIVMEGNIQGNKPQEKIVRLEEEITKTDKQIKPLLNIILAKWYWHYYSRNRYRFIRRSRTSGLDSKDFTTWDLPKLFGHVGNLYENVLKSSAYLQSQPISKLKGFINMGNQPESLRSTLFDFFAHEALTFYMLDDQSLAKPMRAFEIDSDSPALKDLKAFLAWSPKSFDKDSCNFRAVKLFQKLLKFSAKSNNRDAILDNDLLRLRWAKQVAVGENISQKYLEQLTAFASENYDHPYSATAYGYIAQELKSKNKLVEAFSAAEKGIGNHPNSYGEQLCKSIKAQILAKSLNIETEKVILSSRSQIKVSYQNLDKIYFRLIPRSAESLLQKNKYSPDDINWDDYSELFSMTPSQEWSVDLAPTSDYKVKETLIDLPKIAPGLYYLAASAKDSFPKSKNILKITSVIVSKLGMIVRKRQGKLETFIVNNVSGKPIPGVSVKAYKHEYNKGWKQINSGQTNKDGMLTFNSMNGNGFFIASHKGHKIYKTTDFYSYKPNNYNSGTRIFFFTDRAIYRPGQTIYFKGILAKWNTKTNEYEVKKNNNVSVTFRDPNHQQVKLSSFTTNEYGSFSGTFTAPADRLTGRYRIQGHGHSGMTAFRVEEYKRPKFKVELEKPTESFKLGKRVKVTGNAIAYTGAKIDGAKVKYRVVREVRLPAWCWWYYNPGSSQEITHGTTTTQKDGSFEIKFTAKPDRSIPEKNEPTFSFRVYADVTDSNGETRSDNTRINIGYTAMALNLSAQATSFANKKYPITISTQTLDGKGIPGAGTLLIYSLKQPQMPKRKPYFSGKEIDKNDLSNPRTWEKGKVVFENSFKTSINGIKIINAKLPEGAYRIEAQSRDKYNNPVKAQFNLTIVDPASSKFNIKIPNFFTYISPSAQPGLTFKAMWATGYNSGPAYIEVEHRNKLLQSFWTDPSKNLAKIEVPIDESFRGGFIIRVMQIKENREYFHSRYVPVRWTNKKLNLKFSHITSKLQPGQKDIWSVLISGEDAELKAIEMLATMYDASLDAYAKNNWPASFNLFYSDSNHVHPSFSNTRRSLYSWKSDLNRYYSVSSRSYPSLPYNICNDFLAYHFPRPRRKGGIRAFKSGAPAPMMALSEAAAPEMEDGIAMADSFEGNAVGKAQAPGRMVAKKRKANGGGKAEDKKKEQEPDLSKVSARQNLNETAFFYPHLTANAKGEVEIKFTIPEALTTWKFLGFAHGDKLQAGNLLGETITQKDLMVQPNPPRFLREDDKLEFTAKVTNLSAETQQGKIKLSLLDPVNDKNRNSEFKIKEETLSFEVPAGESKSFSWPLTVPDTPGILKYKVVGATNKLSDGEEGLLPILSRRIFVTESLPLPINGPAKKKFSFKKLINSKSSDTLKHQGLTVEVTSNPAWYAVQALPYLMEYPHECSEQIFNRLYANQIAGFIANSDPKIRKVFETWKEEEKVGGKALYSNLEKNQHLKSVVLLETPWVRQAKSETEAKHRIGLLFNQNNLESQMNRALKKLENYQLSDGAFPWFPGGRPNSYITLYIMTGFARMRHLGVDVNVAMALKSLNYLDAWIDKYYREILRIPGYQKRVNINPTVAMYLYGRSFFLKERPIPSSSKEAVEFFINEAKNKWLKVGSRLAQGHIALALKRFDDKKTPADIVNSIRERSVTDEELGMFWRENEISFWWYRAEIETQAVMIELFDEVANDEESVENCKIWLLKQKQTQNWKTTKATADAVYALLLKGTDLLASDKLVKVYLGGSEVKPEKVEAGTGYYQKVYAGSEVKSSMGQIDLQKDDKGVAWGAVHWQYLEDMSKITPHETNLKLKKSLFVKKNTEKGPTISPVKGNLSVGDLVVVRIELRTDRDMEYIHMKDQRGSGLEPVNVISRYKYQDGLAYYEATKDTATHFYIDYLPKGTYVFEYELRVQHKGTYQSGMAQIQCMYAPEFNSHSESFIMNVR